MMIWYACDKDDRITQVQYGDATHKVDYAYDGFGRLNTRKVYNGASSPVLTSQYTAILFRETRRKNNYKGRFLLRIYSGRIRSMGRLLSILILCLSFVKACMVVAYKWI